MPTTTLAGLLERPATEQAALVRSGAVSASELVEAAIAAIEASDLNAFAAVAPEQALAEAARVAPGDPRPLCGVPTGIKDLLYATAGVPVSHGSAAFGDWVPQHDAPHVRGLRAAGAIVVGRTTTPELGLRPVTESDRYGVTRNPRDGALIAGGSSGGSAAAVAGGLAGLCDGSDMGGSVRIPAACCGVVGLRPTSRLVDNGPDLGDLIGETLTPGPIARSVDDAAVALDAMVGGSRFAAAARRAPGRLTVHVAAGAPLGIPVDAEPRATLERAAGLLTDLGHDVGDRTPAWDDDGFRGAWMIGGTAMSRHMVRIIDRLHGRGFAAERLEPATRAWLVDGPPVRAEDLIAAIDALRAYARRILTGWPPDAVLVCPTLTCSPPPADAPGDPERLSALVRVWSVTGQPALSLPVTPTAAVQIVAAPGRDDLVLSLAAQLEGALR